VPQLGVALVLLALVLVSLWLVVWRLARVERRVDGLARSDDVQKIVEAAGSDARFRPLEEGIRRVADSLGRLPTPLEAKDLVPLQERLELLARVTDELRHHVDELRSRDPIAAAELGPGARVLRTLEQRGFDSIRILAQVLEDEAGEAARIPVEAHRAGMSYKGFVTLEDGRVAEVALKPVTEVFP